MTIAILDVHYEAERARAACVVADAWKATTPHSTLVREVDAVEPYEPGNFYRRELPCLLAVLDLLPSPPEAVVVDGYVWLGARERPGLGARLHEALGGRVPVVGIAKSAFAGIEESAEVVAVQRGNSRKPLFVTAAGMDARTAARHVHAMAGSHRVPSLARLADRTARCGWRGGP